MLYRVFHCVKYEEQQKDTHHPSPVQKLASVHDACHGRYLHSDWFKKLM